MAALLFNIYGQPNHCNTVGAIVWGIIELLAEHVGIDLFV